jgi:hypothetical protein
VLIALVHDVASSRSLPAAADRVDWESADAMIWLGSSAWFSSSPSWPSAGFSDDRAALSKVAAAPSAGDCRGTTRGMRYRRHLLWHTDHNLGPNTKRAPIDVRG